MLSSVALWSSLKLFNLSQQRARKLGDCLPTCAHATVSECTFRALCDIGGCLLLMPVSQSARFVHPGTEYALLKSLRRSGSREAEPEAIKGSRSMKTNTAGAQTEFWKVECLQSQEYVGRNSSSNRLSPDFPVFYTPKRERASCWETHRNALMHTNMPGYAQDSETDWLLAPKPFLIQFSIRVKQ